MESGKSPGTDGLPAEFYKVFLEKKRKQNIVWELAKMFETMLGVQLWRAINAQCTTRVGTGACTVISRSFARSVDIVAWPVQR